MKRRLVSLLCVISVIIALCPTALALTPQEDMARMDQVIALIEQKGLDYGGEDVLRRGLEEMFRRDPESFDLLMDSILSSYDPHSTYVPAGGYDTAFPSVDSYAGIGVTLSKEGLHTMVSEISPYGPAAKTGLLPGDILTQINGNDVTASTLEQTAELLRGAEGEKITLSVDRAGTALTFEMTRSAVTTPNLVSRGLGNDLYYIKISRFDDAYTYMLFSDAVSAMKEAGSRGLVLDLRGNPGGEINMVMNFINKLIPDDGKTYFTLRTRDGRESSYVSTGRGLRLEKGIVILCDGGSASASEIMTSALHDLGYAVTVGQTTYGKARGQNHVVFEDGAAAVLTTVQLVPPSGVDYEGVGLTPDYVVENTVAAHPAAACRKLSFRQLSIGAKGLNASDLLAALRAIGYMDDNGTHNSFDREMMAAVNSFRTDMGLEPMTYVNAQTVNMINSALTSMSRLTSVNDLQLAKAVELLSK